VSGLDGLPTARFIRALNSIRVTYLGKEEPGPDGYRVRVKNQIGRKNPAARTTTKSDAGRSPPGNAAEPITAKAKPG
jgi:hypothetical protein